MSTNEFNTQLNKLNTLLHAFAYSLTKNSEDSKDLYQETAFRALTNRDKFVVGTNFKAWTFTIMKNIFINNYRKKVKANTLIDTTDNQYFLNSTTNSIGNVAESDMMVAELMAMINALDESVRIPFMMHFEGHKYQDISDFLGLPLGTVKSRIFFARKELKENVTGFYGKSFAATWAKSDASEAA